LELHELTNLNQLPNLIYEYRWNNDSSKSVLNVLLHFLDADKLQDIYRKQKKGVIFFGRTLASLGKVYLDEDQKVLAALMARNMVEMSDLEKEDISSISLMAHHLSYTDEDAYFTFLNKVIEHIDLEKYIELPFKRGLLPLIKQLNAVDKTKVAISQSRIDGLVDKIYEQELDLLLRKMSGQEFNKLLWELLQIDKHKLSDWTKSINRNVWIRKVRKEADRDNLFRLCWIMEHLDRYLTQTLAENIARDYRHSRHTHIYDVPLLAYLMKEHRMRYRAFIPEPYFLVKYISDHHYTLSHIAYTVWFINRIDRRKMYNFRGYLSRLSHYKNPQYSWDKLIDSYPLQESKSMLLQMLGHFSLLHEPGLTFKQIENRLLYSTSSLNEVRFDDAMNLCYSSHPKSIFKDRDVARTYLKLYFEERGWSAK